jgi:hypothetical protein
VGRRHSTILASEQRLVFAATGRGGRVLFQRNPVSRSNKALGRQNACSWAPGNSLDADKFGNRLTFVLRHDPPCFVTDYRTSRDCGIRHLPLFGMLGRSTLRDGMYSCQWVKWLTGGKMVIATKKRGLRLKVCWDRY